AGEPGELAVEPLRVEPFRPIDNLPIEFHALALELLPVRIETGGVFDADRHLGGAGETGHPGAVAPQEMVERAVDRAEKRAAIALAFGVAQAIRGAVQVLVLPAVIARHFAHVVFVDHGLSPAPPYCTATPFSIAALLSR